ncbi:Response regulator [Sulfidibacter corallicola]|uniref:histidine kinase n=1 Tax=Sulfidibacter corallicola TaxID=2818388 RepID=A0A8A4TUW6_SULCO|nr:response regulator [Sulfidibacter corallicola]QTD52924.1 response regulator [Sulfidibacter corallicola]
MKILIVDDSRVCRRMYRKELEKGGYETIEASDGIEALEVVHRNEIHLVVLDVEMPNMDGVEACEHLRSEEFTTRFRGDEQAFGQVLPIIFVTSNPTFEGRIQSFNKGATDFILKGFRPGRLLETVNRILKPRSALEGLTALVADDSKFVRRMLIKYMREEKINIIEAENGNQAFDIICERQKEIDVVITDLEMPGMNGDLLCRKIRRELGLKAIPVVILTARTEQHLLLGLFNAGATDYLVKPFQKEELLARLKVSVEVIHDLERRIAAQNRAMDRQQERLAKEHARATNQAQVATAVLHNIANVLNSVSVSCSVVHRRIHDSKVKQMLLAHGLIEDHLDNLDNYLTRDEKGKLLPEYLIALGKRIESEQITIAHELKDLGAKIQLMKQAIESQQHYAKGNEIHEPVSPDAVLEEALLVQSNLIETHQIQIQSDLNAPNQLALPKAKLVHVFINLIKNGIEAMRAAETRVLSLESREAQGAISVHISDTGIGIEPEHRKKLFTHGFTTKKDGHGFGLAYCAKAIEEMGGTLEVHSEGSGKGTRFSIHFSPASN